MYKIDHELIENHGLGNYGRTILGLRIIYARKTFSGNKWYEQESRENGFNLLDLAHTHYETLVPIHY